MATDIKNLIGANITRIERDHSNGYRIKIFGKNGRGKEQLILDLHEMDTFDGAGNLFDTNEVV